MSTIKLVPQPAESSMANDWLEEARQTGQVDTYTGKRVHPRITWSAPLEVHALRPDGRAETFYATARDISSGGLGFQCRQAIPPCTPVRICRAGQIEGLPGMTVHCTQSLRGYVIGVEFRFAEQQAQSQTRAVRAKAG